MEYTCAICGETYEAGWSDEEAEAEMEENFGEVDEENRAVVCDGCYKEFIEPTFS